MKNNSDEEPCCEACGVLWFANLGITGTCKKLTNARTALKCIELELDSAEHDIKAIIHLCKETLEHTK